MPNFYSRSGDRNPYRCPRHDHMLRSLLTNYFLRECNKTTTTNHRGLCFPTLALLQVQLKMACLQSEVGTNDSYWVTNLTKSAPKVSSKLLSPYFGGPKKKPQNSRQTSRIISFKKIKKNSPKSFCRGEKVFPEPGAHLSFLLRDRPQNSRGEKLGHPKNSETKNQPKDRSFRPDVPADIRPKTSVRPSKSWKNKHFGTDMPRGRPRKNFGLKNFGLIFRIPERRKLTN